MAAPRPTARRCCRTARRGALPTHRELEPRVELVRDHPLMRPMRGPADWSGDPEHARDAAEQAEFDRMVDSAEVLFGLPDVEPAALAEPRPPIQDSAGS